MDPSFIDSVSVKHVLRQKSKVFIVGISKSGLFIIDGVFIIQRLRVRERDFISELEAWKWNAFF